MFVQAPIRSTVLHDAFTQLPLTEFFIGCILLERVLKTAKNFVRQTPSSVPMTILGVSHASLTCTLTRSNLDCDDLVRTLAPRALLQPPPGLEQYAPPPGLAVDAHFCTPHGIPGKAAPLRPRLRSAVSVTPPAAPCSVPSHVGTHHVRDQLLPAREVLVLLWREPTTLLANTDSSCRDWPFS